MKPSDFCKQELGMHEVKREGFLKSYWDADSLTAAAREYKQLSKIPRASCAWQTSSGKGLQPPQYP